MAIQIYRHVKQVPMSQKDIETIVLLVLRSIKRPKTTDVSVHCIGNARMRTLNRLYHGADRPTDVLSFGIDDPTGAELGDIFLNVPYIRVQAKKWNVSLRDEMVRMLIHGVLHLAGHDHEKKSEAAEMFQLQEHIHARAMRLI